MAAGLLTRLECACDENPAVDRGAPLLLEEATFAFCSSSLEEESNLDARMPPPPPPPLLLLSFFSRCELEAECIVSVLTTWTPH